MAKNIPSGARKMQVLFWIDAIQGDYGTMKGVDIPPTVGNIAYYLVKSRAIPDIMDSRVDNYRMKSNPDRNEWYECRDYLSTLIVSEHDGLFLVEEYADLREEENIPFRVGWNSRNKSCNIYRISQRGINEMNDLARSFDRRVDVMNNMNIRGAFGNTIKLPDVDRGKGSYDYEAYYIPYNKIDDEIVKYIKGVDLKYIDESKIPDKVLNA